MTDRWPEAVVFDLDGTLIDSAGDITDALNAVLRQSRLEPFTEAEVRHLMTHEWARTAEDVLWRRTKMGLRLSPDQVSALEAYMADAARVTVAAE